jgi:hypothetical protein
MRCPRCRGCLIPCADEYSPVLCINCGWRALYPDVLPPNLRKGGAKLANVLEVKAR